MWEQKRESGAVCQKDPDENVYPVVMSFGEVEDAIRKGTIFDAKTLSAWLMYKLIQKDDK